MKMKPTHRLALIITSIISLTLLVALLIVAYIVTTDSKPEPTSDSTPEPQVYEDYIDEDEYDNYVGEEPTMEDQIWEVNAMLADSFAGVAYVDFDADSHLYTVIPSSPEFISELEDLITGDMPMEEWYAVSDNFQELSEGITALLDSSYGIVLINPNNPALMLLHAQDDMIIYDVFRDEFEVENYDDLPHY